MVVFGMATIVAGGNCLRAIPNSGMRKSEKMLSATRQLAEDYGKWAGEFSWFGAVAWPMILRILPGRLTRIASRRADAARLKLQPTALGIEKLGKSSRLRFSERKIKKTHTGSQYRALVCGHYLGFLFAYSQCLAHTATSIL